MKVKCLIDVFYAGSRRRKGTILDVPDSFKINPKGRMFEVVSDVVEEEPVVVERKRRGRNSDMNVI